MDPAGGERAGHRSGAYTIADRIPERMGLCPAPDRVLFSSFVVTWSAARALARIDAAQSDAGGKIFWIGGAPGGGKTHFLNYLLAFEDGAPPGGETRGRRIVFTVELADPTRPERLEAQVLEALARALSGGDPRATINWHGARGADALSVALGQARRVNIDGISGFIDLGTAQAVPSEYLEAMAATAAASRQVRLNIFIAARIAPPELSLALEIAPEDAPEAMRTGIARARRLHDGVEEPAARAYREAGLEVRNAIAIYPFHPDSVEMLQALADPPGTVAAIAILARDVLLAANNRELIYPFEIIAAPALRKIVRERIGDAQWSAVEIADDRMRALPAHERRAGEEVLAMLALKRAAFREPALATDRLECLVPALAAGAVAPQETLRRIAESSGGVIRVETGSLVLDPGAASAPTVAAFNSALALVKQFAPDLAYPADAEHIAKAEARLTEAMSQAAERAAQVEDALRSALAGYNLEFPEEHRRTIEKYIEIAAAGVRALEEAGSDRARIEAQMRVVADYQALAAAAEMAPQIRAMREYLDKTGLGARYDQQSSGDPALAALEVECQLLCAEMTPRLLLHPPRTLDALRARFQKFRWNYVAAYQSAHSGWREEMRRAATLAENLRLHAGALARLNSIAALGEPQGRDGIAAAAQFSDAIKPCEMEGPLAIELVPRCAGCGYLLGARSPSHDIADLTDRIRAGIAEKLAALSRSAIARIIREHDSAGRLEAFLKITQAAQTDALVRVLDDTLARYLARLLEENLEEADRSAPAPLFGGGDGHNRRHFAHGGSKRPRAK